MIKITNRSNSRGASCGLPFSPKPLLGPGVAVEPVKGTPSQTESSMLQRVTQCRSVVNVFLGRAVNSSQASSKGFSTRPEIFRRHRPKSILGVGPSVSTGNFSLRNRPGGIRPANPYPSPFSDSLSEASSRASPGRSRPSLPLLSLLPLKLLFRCPAVNLISILPGLPLPWLCLASNRFPRQSFPQGKKICPFH